mmetsp:Transcript_49484/g.80213  ORF Transcript_49484/g.80213 Transcript_49484/m.80213 type:complete len:218 (+) Transcript_49484:2472-3125(+)
MLGVHGFLDLVHPALHYVRDVSVQNHPAHQSGRGHERVVVNDGCLEVAVYLRCHGWVQDAGEHADRVRPEAVVLAVHVFDEAGHANENLGLRRLQLLDDQVDHAPQAAALALEELGDIEEQLRQLCWRELLALLEQVKDSCEQLQALGGVEGCLTEAASLLHHRRLVLLAPRVFELPLFHLEVLLQSCGDLLLDGILQRGACHDRSWAPRAGSWKLQ